ncbi:MAG: ABC transporter permease, partial [Ruminococcus flavefaciens]|nr:ABC transporter permease [Ruminococcus flavefaciens]
MKAFAALEKKRLEQAAVLGTRRHSRTADIWRRLVRDKSAVASMVFLGIVILLAVFANVLFDESAVTTQNINMRNCPPSWEHWFGTDLYGRDIFVRMVFGSRVSLIIGVVTMVTSMIIGGLLGAVAAYFGKATDSII